MKDQEKTKAQLIDELAELRDRVAELEVVETEQRHATEQVGFQVQLLDSVRESVIATDLEGQVIYWGKGAEALYGYSADEVMDKPITFIVQPQEEAEEFERMRQVRETGFWNGQYAQQRKDGSMFWGDTMISLVRARDGRPCGLIGIDRDITARKQMEQQIRHRLAIEEAVSRASRLFISSGPADLQEILQLIGEAVSVNRTYIFQFRENGTKMDNTHEWCDPKTEPQINKLQDVDTARFPWWQKKLEKSENIVISDVNALPPDAASEKEDLRAQHIRALLAVPIYSAVDTLAGFIGFDDTEECRAWNAQDIRALQVVVDMVGRYWERRRSEVASRESEEKYRALFELASDAILTVLPPEGEVVGANLAAVQMLGYSKEELEGLTGQQIIAPERLEVTNNQWETQVEDKGYFRLETIWVSKDGARVPVEVSGRPLEIGGKAQFQLIGRDIAKRSQAEEKLRNYTERLRILREIDRGILAARLPEEIAEVALHHIRRLVPCQRCSVVMFDTKLRLGTMLAALVDGDTKLGTGVSLPWKMFDVTEKFSRGQVNIVADIRLMLPPLPPTVQTLLAEGLRSYISVPLLYKDELIGSLNLGSSSPGTFSAEQTEVIREVANSLAVAIQNARLHEQVRQHAVQLEQTQQQVIQQERLSALGQMASGIAHDFNNALSPILGFSELLLTHPEYLDDKAKAARYLQTVNTAAKDAAHVVRHMREFYRHRDPGEIFHAVNLNRLVKEVISLAQPKWKDQAQLNGINIKVETDLQNVPRLAGNEAELREVLTNLIFNAVDAMPSDGTLTLRTRSDDQHVHLEVNDTGMGMTEEVLQRCLEPFFTTKGGKGTGLGLSMVFGIIQRHKGKIDIQSEVGRGTTFHIRLLPFKTDRTEDTRQEQESVPHALHVLVVEDEPMVRHMVAEYLTIDGCTVETATNGREGLEKFHAGHFDLVVTDRAMPDMNGDQLAVLIKRITPNKPVIMLTGFGDLMQDSGECPVGVDRIVSKPVTLSAFRQAIAHLGLNGTDLRILEPRKLS